MDLHNPSAWRSYDQEPLSSDQDSGTLVPVPKFDVDPEVPLETMVALDSASDQSGEPDTDHMKHNTGWYFCTVLLLVLKVSKSQKEFMKASFLPKIVRISAL